ncbi:sigma-70 family RNA polymerase sigma factor [Pararhodobacter marinus]|nr:sigma-70 family RNA polymerase sigma factor [Pararhodobacter marinus]|eukprot:m.264745 g.264745  ORF g.264745 m.264745 type:complete len:184 (+) comp58731_c0_seq1:196-747(+)
MKLASEAMGGKAAVRPPVSVQRDSSETVQSDAVIEFIPPLRLFARSLCKNPVEADDLVQETLLRAIENIHLYKPGTNLRAWLFTIMRNRFYSNCIKQAREKPGSKDCVASIPVGIVDTQYWHLRMSEMVRAINDLPVHFRETFVAVVILGVSYLDAAEMFDCDIGTIKSRIYRARATLASATQ